MGKVNLLIYTFTSDSLMHSEVLVAYGLDHTHLDVFVEEDFPRGRIATETIAAHLFSDAPFLPRQIPEHRHTWWASGD